MDNINTFSFKDILIKIKERQNDYTAKMSDETAKLYPLFFPIWETDHEYQEGERIRFNNALYKTIKTHTSSEDLIPSESDIYQKL